MLLLAAAGLSGSAAASSAEERVGAQRADGQQAGRGSRQGQQRNRQQSGKQQAGAAAQGLPTTGKACGSGGSRRHELPCRHNQASMHAHPIIALTTRQACTPQGKQH